jgi:hypothetical protein
MATWQIVSLEVKATPDSSSRNDVVQIVHYTASESGSGKTVSMRGKKELTAPSDSFTEFADLTEGDVFNWIWADGNKASVEASLTQKLNTITNSDRVQKALPWE